MKLTFLGTRGCTDTRPPEHHMHTSLLVSYRGRGVRIDCGEDWLGRCDDVRARAIVITHCHPDHAWGLCDGAPCPIYATADSWRAMSDWPIGEQHIIEHREPVEIAGMSFEAFPVEHSTICPAVGYRITAGRVTVFHAPDVVFIRDRESALEGCKAYIGDGATLDRSFVRREKDTGALIGHTPVRTQLTWCQRAGVPRMIVTHCGPDVVADHDEAVRKVGEWAAERGVAAEIATDGLEVVLR